jgi:hypothetical protein
MSESPVPKSRRKLLKSIAIGGGAIAVAKTLPESWTKPVIDSVMLPAHGQASITTYFGLSVGGTGFGGLSPPDDGIHGCIVVTGDEADVTFQGSENNGRRNGVVPTDGTLADAVMVAAVSGCNVRTVEISITALSPDSITLKVHSPNADPPSSSGYEVTFEAGACASLPALNGGCDD